MPNLMPESKKRDDDYESSDGKSMDCSAQRLIPYRHPYNMDNKSTICLIPALIPRGEHDDDKLT
jgi:hypothetical protein